MGQQVADSWMTQPDTLPETSANSSHFQKNFTIRMDDYQSTFTLGKSLKNKKYLVAAVVADGPHILKTNGSNSAMIAVTPKGVKRFRRKYEGKKHCSGQFINNNTEQILLYASTNQIARKLKNWHREKYTYISTWEEVSISGRCVTGREKLSKNDETINKRGNETPINSMMTKVHQGFKNCNSIWVESISMRPSGLDNAKT